MNRNSVSEFNWPERVTKAGLISDRRGSDGNLEGQRVLQSRRKSKTFQVRRPSGIRQDVGSTPIQKEFHMSTNDATGHENSLLREAISDIQGAHAMLHNSMDEAGTLQIDPAAAVDVAEDQIDKMRRRAHRERLRGIKGLEKRHEGVASIMMDVVINERVTASGFERWFSGIENGVFVLMKRGHMFVGEKNADALIAEFTAKLEAQEQELKTDLAGVKTRLENLDQNNMIVPTYSSPASSRNVQLRSPLSNRVLKLVLGHDQVLSGLVKLQWNGEVEQEFIVDQENKAKQAMRDLAKFLTRTIRGMRDRVAKSEAPAAGAANAPQLELESAA